MGISEVKKTEGESIESRDSKLSAQDLRLKRFIELSAEVKRLTAELDALKDDFKHRGSFSTHHFVCIVEERERVNPPAVSILIDKYGPGAESICTRSTYKTVKVTAKGEGGAL